MVFAPLGAYVPWVVGVRTFAFPSGSHLPFPLLWGDESGGYLIVSRESSLLVYVDDFFSAGGEDIFALYGEYPPGDVDTFLPGGGVVYVCNVVAVRV